MMRRFTAILALSFCCAWAGAPGDAFADDANQAAKKPAELAGDAIDPYVPARERTRFLKNAGVDNELDTKEFAATQGKDGAFARIWDSWDALKKFDKDNNGTIDWFEADAYRRAGRKQVLAALDANKDGRLTGDERDKLNKALAAGKLPGQAVQAGRGSLPARLGGALNDETRKKYDADGDGKLSRDEMRRLWKDRQAAFVNKHDADGDGKLNADEMKAATKAAMETVKGRLRQRMMRQYDADGDGELNEEENAAYEAAKKKLEDRLADWKKRAAEKRAEMIKKYDTDGDGAISKDERRAAREAIRAEYVKKYDTDGDGKVSREERRAAWKEMRKKFILRRYDADGDGELSEEEKAKHQADREAIRKRIRERARQWRQRTGSDSDDGDSSSSSSGESSDGPITVTENEDGTATVILGR
ncbi:MAG: hypothetical protein ACLFVH_06305 [Phycisphaerae bacterium]